MSYQRKSYRLTWPEGHVRHGLVVVMRGLSINDLQIVSSMKGMKSDDFEPEQIKEVLVVLSKRMISWNLTDEDDAPIAVTPEALVDEDFSMIMEIITSWTNAAVGVKADLGKGSNSGSTFPEGSIPMEQLSPSQTS